MTDIDPNKDGSDQLVSGNFLTVDNKLVEILSSFEIEAKPAGSSGKLDVQGVSNLYFENNFLKSKYTHF